jgi:TPR repeat protein
MFSHLKRKLLARRMKQLISLATEAIYLEQFDMSPTVKRLSGETGGITLVRAYIAVSIAAGLTDPLSKADVDSALEKLRAAEQHFGKPDFDTILQMHKVLAERNWSRRRAAILSGRQAFKNDEFSYAGIIYSLEQATRRPCSPDERKEARTDHERIVGAKRKLEEHLAKKTEPDGQQQATAQQIKEELDRLNREMERFHELELLQEEMLRQDPATICSFGQMALDGDGVPQDYVEAVKWFRIAAERGHAKAQHNLAFMYENGQGVSQDYAEAAKWYHMAAAQGLASSQNNLGVLCESGNGVAQDHADAIKWYRRAAENGDANGVDNLNRLEAHLQGDEYYKIVQAFIDLMAAHTPLIGDCCKLPYPKRTILYAIRWVLDDCDTRRGAATDQALRERYDKMLPFVGYLFTCLARDWQEIAPEDKDAVAKLGDCDSFPDWALPLKAKYISDEKAREEALEVAYQVLVDKVEREKRSGNADNSTERRA